MNGESSNIQVDTGQVKSVDGISSFVGDGSSSMQTDAFTSLIDAQSDNSSSEGELLTVVNCAICGLKFGTEDECTTHMDASHNTSALGLYISVFSTAFHVSIAI